MTKEKKRSTGVKFVMADGKLEWQAPGDNGGLLRVQFDPDKASAELRHKAMLYGFRVAGDRMTAVSRDTDTGLSATPAQKFERVKRRIEQAWEMDLWEIPRSAMPAPKFDAGLVIQAMIRALSGVNDPDGAERLIAKTIKAGKAEDRDGALKMWAATSQVAEAIVLIRAERAAASTKLDSDDLLAELEGLDDGYEDEDDDSDDEDAPM